MSGPSRPDISDLNLFSVLERLVIADPGEAVNRAERELPAIDRDQIISDQLRLRRMLAMAYAHTGQFDRSLGVCVQAIGLEAAPDAPVELARVRLASMQPLAHLGRIDEAIQAGQLALRVLESEGSTSLAGRAALNLGSIYAMTGHHEDALQSFDRALEYLASDSILAGQIETNRGTSLAALDRFEDAEGAFSQAGRLLGAELPWASAVVEGNLADLAARQGEINRSLRHFEASRRHLEQEEAFGDLGRLDAEEAAVLSIAGLTTVAAESFERAIGLLIDHGTPGDLALARIGYGRALVEIGAVDDAEAMLESAHVLIDSEENPDLYQQYLRLAARISIERGYFDQAASLIFTGIDRVQERPIQKLGWALLHAHVARLRGDKHQAQSILSSALDDARKYRVTPLIADISGTLADIVRELGDDQRADDLSREAIEGYETIRGTIQASNLRQTWHHSRLEVYGEFASSLMARDDADAQREAFAVAERIRSRVLLDTLKSGEEDLRDQESIAPNEQPLADELRSHRHWLNWTYSSLARGLELTQDQISELHDREQAASRIEDRLALLRPEDGLHAPISLEAVHELLENETLVLSYLMVGDSLTLQVIGPDFIHGFVDLCTTEQLSELVSEMQFQVGRALVSSASTVPPRRAARLERDMDTVLEHLYDLLILPVESFVTDYSRCLIIPTGDLHSVPFAALKHDGEYLGDLCALTTAPSASVLASMSPRRQPGVFSPKHPLIVGVPDESAPGLGNEAEALAAAHQNARLLLGLQATRNAVVNATHGADLIHLACHGRFDPSYPAASGLQLEDGWLTLDDLRNLQLDEPLVVLSGCETGRARIDRGDDLVGLMAAFVAAGARGLVTSLWKTHDVATMAFMESLYKALLEGNDLARANQISQIRVRQDFGHPAMWAPFVSMSA